METNIKKEKKKHNYVILIKITLKVKLKENSEIDENYISVRNLKSNNFF